MKVVCVDDSFAPVSKQGILAAECKFPNGWLVAGDTYTVISVQGTNYIIEEKPIIGPHMQNGGWTSRRFVPLEYFQAEFQVAEERTAQHAVNATTLAGVGIAQINEHPARI